MVSANRGLVAIKRAAAIGKAAESVPPVPQKAVGFDPSKETLILDFKAACQLPFNPDNGGVKAFRAIIFPKGFGHHVPDEPAKLLLVGEYRRQYALELVHFDPSTARDPELLLAFVDYGLANSAMSGVSVETLPLPLHIAKKNYNTESRLTPITSVVAFEPIDCGKAPWSIHLKPCLEKIALFKRTEAFNSKLMKEWIKTKVEPRLKKLHMWATDDISAEIAAISRQDYSQGTKQGSVFTAKLNALFDSIHKWPLDSFDLGLSERIEVVKIGARGAESMPPWIGSPAARQLVRGACLFSPNRLKPRQLLLEDTDKTLDVLDDTQEASEEMPEFSEKIFEEAEEEEIPKSEIKEDDKVELPAAKRERKLVTPFEPPLQVVKRNKKDKQDKEVKAEQPNTPALINPRTGKPYVKGPYNSGGTGSRSGSADERHSSHKKTGSKAFVDLTEDHKQETKELQDNISALKEKIQQLTAECASAKAEIEMMKQSSAEAVGRAHANGKLEAIREAAKQFQLGLQAGAQLAKGLMPRFAEDDAASDDQ